MQGAGYSGKTISEKLGIPQKSKKYKFFSYFVINAPENYKKELGRLPENATQAKKFIDIIHLFTKNEAELRDKFPELKKLLRVDGFLWISWPKGSSKIETDLNENIVRDIGLENRMVDVKVIAIDEDWSALKFVFRVGDRDQLAKSKNSS